MTVEEARAQYAAVATALLGALTNHLMGPRLTEMWRCPACQWLGSEIEAASLALDLAVSEASRQRTRETVAW